MAKEIVWERLTQTETETLTELEKSGVEVYAAPIKIEHKDQLKTLGITWADCRTWRIGSKKVIVHLTPADKATYDMLLGDLCTKHCNEYRRKHCQTPDKLKSTVLCAECPYPKYREKHRANSISWEELIENAYEGTDTEAAEDAGIHQKEIEMELAAVCKVIDAKNPLYTMAIILKEYYDLDVDEIARRLNTPKRNVYFYLSEAKKIGKQYKEGNY